MHILVTNDDGIHAPGLEVAIALANALCGSNGRVSIIAPSVEKSGVSHAVTDTMPMTTHKLSEDRFAVDGTPADCVLLANELLGKWPDLVISGVNRGHNLGPDLLYSGTVGAAIEATAHHIPAIAISQKYAYGEASIDTFATSRAFALKTIEPILKSKFANWPSGRFLNVNFPSVSPENVKGVKACRAEVLSKSNMIAIPAKAPSGKQVFWLGHPGPIKAYESGADVDFIHKGYVTVSFCHIDLSDDQLSSELTQLLGDL